MSASHAPATTLAQLQGKAATAIFRGSRIATIQKHLKLIKDAKAINQAIAKGEIHEGRTFLTVACGLQNLNLPIINFLLEQGCDPTVSGSGNYKENAFTLLAKKPAHFFNSFYNEMRKIKSADEIRVSLNKHDENGFTPLIAAVRGIVNEAKDETLTVAKGHLDTVKALILKGVDLTIPSVIPPNKRGEPVKLGHSVLWHACDRSHAKIAEYLVDQCKYIDKIQTTTECNSIIKVIEVSLVANRNLTEADKKIFLEITQKLQLQCAKLEAISATKKTLATKPDPDATESESESESESEDDVSTATLSSSEEETDSLSDDDTPLSQISQKLAARSVANGAKSPASISADSAKLVTRGAARAKSISAFKINAGKSDKDEKIFVKTTVSSTSASAPMNALSSVEESKFENTRRPKRKIAAIEETTGTETQLNAPSLCIDKEPKTKVPSPPLCPAAFNTSQWLTRSLFSAPVPTATSAKRGADGESQPKKLKPLHGLGESSSFSTILNRLDKVSEVKSSSQPSSTNPLAALVSLAAKRRVKGNNQTGQSTSSSESVPLPLPYVPYSSAPSTFNAQGLININIILKHPEVLAFAKIDAKFKLLLDNLIQQQNATTLVAIAEYSHQVTVPPGIKLNGMVIAQRLLTAGNQLGWDLATPAKALVKKQLQNSTTSREQDMRAAVTFLNSLSVIQPSLIVSSVVVDLNNQLLKTTLHL